MFPLSVLLSPLSVMLSLSTATGVLVHDTRIDKVTMTVLAAPAVAVGSTMSAKLGQLSTDTHPHSERNSLSQSVNDLKGQNPRVQPRSPADKKYVSQKNSGFGHNPLDSYAFAG